jgi:TetR/AcrR family transcriptional regulator, mexJK operon transcriptional repressor
MSDTPLEPSEFKRGPGGRPTREEAERRHRLLLETAFRLFLDKGWDGVSVEEISRASGVAKGFIYARYADKGALFSEAIERLMADVMGTLHLAEPLPDDVEEGLFALGRKLLDVVLRPEAVAFHRQFIAEAGRLQDLAKHFIARNPARDLIVEVLRTYADRGAVKLNDPRMTAEHFAILVVGIPRTMALLAGREPPAEEERRLRAAVRLFLDGCRPSDCSGPVARMEGAPRP